MYKVECDCLEGLIDERKGAQVMFKKPPIPLYVMSNITVFWNAVKLST